MAPEPAPESSKRQLRTLLDALQVACVNARYTAKVAAEARASNNPLEAAAAEAALTLWLERAQRLQDQIDGHLAANEADCVEQRTGAPKAG